MRVRLWVCACGNLGRPGEQSDWALGAENLEGRHPGGAGIREVSANWEGHQRCRSGLVGGLPEAWAVCGWIDGNAGAG